jgi:hypothetical protein
LQWNVPISSLALETLLNCTERHPFYVNALARTLWDQRKPPTATSIEMAWTQLLADEAERFKVQLLPVPHLTRAVFKALAVEPTATPTTQAFLNSLALSVGTGRAPVMLAGAPPSDSCRLTCHKGRCPRGSAR